LVYPIAIHDNICMPNPDSSKPCQQLEYLTYGLACDDTVETNNLRLARSVLKVAPVWSSTLQRELLLGKKATAPKAEPTRDQCDNIAPDSNPGPSIPGVFDRTDADPDIYVRDKKAPCEVLEIKTAV